ncbi:hypothetical protein [Alienimonas chondri]|uniref:Uncharacterized protein n=1 Tax=Alienimonas chondri TaxID=2681879 RepID=A0ABX1VGP5_9PLAN|nr:hypothetical protein [Alienimonas chondri]NNJ27269.1 hypothetical protein [Alienimonas chondri]
MPAERPASAEPPSDVLAVIRGVLLSDAEAENMCATIESADDDDLWVQVTIDAFNAAYPFPGEPPATLSAQGCPPPTWATLVGWEAGVYATFTHEDATAEELGRFLMDYFAAVLGEENPSFDTVIEDLGIEDFG